MKSRRLSLGLAIAAIAGAVVLFIVLSGDNGSDSDSGSTSTPTKIAFRDGAPVGGVRTVEVAQGDPVRIDVTPDVPAEVHVHGYEVAKEVEAGQTAKLHFTADLEGVFEIEAHHIVHGEEGTGVQVAELNVTP
jgi:hypothetical protein